MAIPARFVQCAQMAQTPLSPKLAGSFEATLTLAASRFDRPTANRPTSISQLFVMHSFQLTSKVVLLFPHCFTRWASRWLQPSNPL
jgi:hypothetical protein